MKRSLRKPRTRRRRYVKEKTRLLVLLVFIPLIFLLTHSYGFFSPAVVVAVVVFFFAVNLTLLLFESSHSFTHEGSGLSAEKKYNL